MKIVFTFLFVVISFLGQAQSSIITKYYDKDWKPITKDSATFYTHLIKKDTVYIYAAYWTKSNKLSEAGTYADTSFSKKIGLFVSYYENGKIKDSTYNDGLGEEIFSYAFYENGKIEDSSISNIDGTYASYGYYENGQLFYRVTEDKNGDIVKSEAYDSTKKIIRNFVLGREAEFSGGVVKWKQYLIKNLRTDFPNKYYKAKEDVVVMAVVRFIVNEEGRVTNVELEESSGIPEADENALSIIRKSPKWINGIYHGKPVNSYRRQPLTYVLSYK